MAALCVAALAGCVTGTTIPNSPFLTAVVKLNPVIAGSRASAGTASNASSPLDANAEATVNNVNSLIQRVAGTSLAEIEKLISELESLRDLLHAEGQRVQREISGYAQLSQAAAEQLVNDGGYLERHELELAPKPGHALAHHRRRWARVPEHECDQGRSPGFHRHRCRSGPDHRQA